ncbi:IPT/TIG domain-containing protein [bacterium]|nr:IPT/TIG domain-containing protein [bacterium]
MTGANFSGATGVSFNGTASGVFQADSDTQLRANVPAGATSGPISVTNPAGTGTSNSSFTVLLPPTISSFTPTSGVEGSEVTINGTDFTNTTAVTFNGTVADVFNVDSPTVIRANVPDGATSGSLSVTNPAGTATSIGDFTVTVPTGGSTFTFNPTHDSFVRDTRPTNTYGSTSELRVRKSSTDYDSFLKFTVNGVSGTVQSAVIRLEVIDAGDFGGDIFLTSTDFLGTSTPWTEADLSASIAPEFIDTALDSKGPVAFGEIVEFDVSAAVSGDGIYSFAISNDHFNTVKYSSKEGVRSPELVITTGSGGSTNPPSITSFSPTSGPAGTEVTISGSDLFGATTVLFNGAVASTVNVDSDSQLRATVPNVATTGPISVSNSVGTETSSSSFTVTTVPSVTSFTPISGVAGTQVTIVGANLTGASVVLFGGTAATVFNVDSDNQLTVTVPAGGNTGVISVTTSAGTGSSSSDFVYLSVPVVTSFSPISGFVGTEVTVTGSGLTGATSISFNNTVAGVFNVDSDSQLRATVPTGATNGVLSVTNAAGTGTSSSDFTVETGGSGGTFTFNPTDDSFVRSTAAEKNYGTDDELRVRKTSTDYDSYFKFTVSGISGQVQSAFLRLEVIDAGDVGGDIHIASNNHLGTSTPWTEETLVFNNAPGITGSPLDSKGAVAFGEIVEFDVTLAISDNGTYSFAISNDHFNTVKYSSKEGSRSPELVITTGSGGASNPPSVTSFSPSSGIAGTQVTVTGANLTGASLVAFNGTAASVFTVDSDNLLTVTAPAGGSTGPISVTTSSGTGSSSSDFAYISAPVITSFSPSSGLVGSEVTLTGSNLSAVTSVLFNGTVAEAFNVDSDTQLRARVPSGATTGGITVSNAAGTGTSSVFTVETGGGGDTFTFNPTDDAQVKQASATKNYGTKVSFKLDAAPVFNSYLKFNVSGLTGAVQGAVLRLEVLNGSDDGGSFYSVSNNFSGTSTPWDENGLTFDTAPALAGTPVSSVGTVDIGLAEIDVTSAISGNGIYSFGLSTASSNLVEYSSKEGATPPQLVITTDSSGSANLPVISSFNPVSGPVGTDVTITGSNFTGASTVSFNGTDAPVFSVDSDTQISVTVPSGTTSGPISVTNGDGTGSSANDFSLFEPPTIASFGPSSGPVGAGVTITGSNFSGLTDISFNGTTAPNFDLDSDNQVRATVPPGASTGKISLTNAAGTTASLADFTVTVGPVVSSFTPILGVVGTQVTISGSNFNGANEVLFNGVAAPSFSVDSDTQITVSVPAGAVSGVISVSTGTGSAASADEFTVVVAPTMTSFSPTSGSVGLEVTIVGSGFSGTTDVAFNSTPAITFVVDSDSEIHVTVPANATTGAISVTNPAGTATSVGEFTVSTAGNETLVFIPTDDAFVRSTRPDNNYARDDELRVRKSSTDYDSYLKFTVTGLTAPVISAVLRLEVINAGQQGGEVYSVSNNLKDSTAAWTEDNLTFNLAPSLPVTPLEVKGAVSFGEIVEFDLSAAITGNGTFSFAISNDHFDTVKYSSKEGSRAPELVITSGLTKRSAESEELTDSKEAELSEDILPQNPTLFPNFPNPFNIETAISYALPEAAKVKLTIYNLRGQLVRVLVDESQKPGIKRVIWDGMNADNTVVGTGVYFIRLKIGEHRLSRKITLQK